jgi:hypothetical protein
VFDAIIFLYWTWINYFHNFTKQISACACFCVKLIYLVYSLFKLFILIFWKCLVGTHHILHYNKALHLLYPSMRRSNPIQNCTSTIVLCCNSFWHLNLQNSKRHRNENDYCYCHIQQCNKWMCPRSSHTRHTHLRTSIYTKKVFTPYIFVYIRASISNTNPTRINIRKINIEERESYRNT